MKSIYSLLLIIAGLTATNSAFACADAANIDLYLSAKSAAKQHHWSEAAAGYQQAAERGCRDAKVDLALYYLRGFGGLPQQVTTSESLLTQAAGEGDPRAARILSKLYLNGRYGLVADLAKASFYDEMSTRLFAHHHSTVVYRG